MSDILNLDVKNETLKNIISNNPFYIDIKGSVNICLIRCGQEIDNCNSVNFSTMTNYGKILILNQNTSIPVKCNIKLAFDNSNDNSDDSGKGNYVFENAFFTVPSLHKLNGQVFDMETFLVFSSIQKNGSVLYICLCIFNSGVDIVKNGDYRLLNYKLLTELFSKNNIVPDIFGTNDISGIPNPVDLNNFIPPLGHRNFYDYTHPLNTSVNFRIYQEPLAVSNDILSILKSKLTPNDTYINFKNSIMKTTNPSSGLFFYFSEDLTNRYKSLENKIIEEQVLHEKFRDTIDTKDTKDTKDLKDKNLYLSSKDRKQSSSDNEGYVKLSSDNLEDEQKTIINQNSEPFQDPITLESEESDSENVLNSESKGTVTKLLMTVSFIVIMHTLVTFYLLNIMYKKDITIDTSVLSVISLLSMKDMSKIISIKIINYFFIIINLLTLFIFICLSINYLNNTNEIPLYSSISGCIISLSIVGLFINILNSLYFYYRTKNYHDDKFTFKESFYFNEILKKIKKKNILSVIKGIIYRDYTEIIKSDILSGGEHKIVPEKFINNDYTKIIKSEILSGGGGKEENLIVPGKVINNEEVNILSKDNINKNGFDYFIDKIQNIKIMENYAHMLFIPIIITIIIITELYLLKFLNNISNKVLKIFYYMIIISIIYLPYIIMLIICTCKISNNNNLIKISILLQIILCIILYILSLCNINAFIYSSIIALAISFITIFISYFVKNISFNKSKILKDGISEEVKKLIINLEETKRSKLDSNIQVSELREYIHNIDLEKSKLYSNLEEAKKSKLDSNIKISELREYIHDTDSEKSKLYSNLESQYKEKELLESKINDLHSVLKDSNGGKSKIELLEMTEKYEELHRSKLENEKQIQDLRNMSKNKSSEFIKQLDEQYQEKQLLESKINNLQSVLKDSNGAKLKTELLEITKKYEELQRSKLENEKQIGELRSLMSKDNKSSEFIKKLDEQYQEKQLLESKINDLQSIIYHNDSDNNSSTYSNSSMDPNDPNFSNDNNDGSKKNNAGSLEKSKENNFGSFGNIYDRNKFNKIEEIEKINQTSFTNNPLHEKLLVETTLPPPSSPSSSSPSSSSSSPPSSSSPSLSSSSSLSSPSLSSSSSPPSSPLPPPPSSSSSPPPSPPPSPPSSPSSPPPSPPPSPPSSPSSPSSPPPPPPPQSSSPSLPSSPSSSSSPPPSPPSSSSSSTSSSPPPPPPPQSSSPSLPSSSSSSSSSSPPPPPPSSLSPPPSSLSPPPLKKIRKLSPPSAEMAKENSKILDERKKKYSQIMKFTQNPSSNIPKTIREFIRSGKIRNNKIINKKCFICNDDLKKFNNTILTFTVLGQELSIHQICFETEGNKKPNKLLPKFRKRPLPPKTSPSTTLPVAETSPPPSTTSISITVASDQNTEEGKLAEEATKAKNAKSLTQSGHRPPPPLERSAKMRRISNKNPNENPNVRVNTPGTGTGISYNPFRWVG